MTVAMNPDNRLIIEIKALRSELLGFSGQMPGSTQFACKRYQNILARLREEVGSDAWLTGTKRAGDSSCAARAQHFDIHL